MAKKPKPAAKPYEATQREREILKAYLIRRKSRKPAPGIKVTGKGGQIDLDHKGPAIGQVLLMEALGTCEAKGPPKAFERAA
jgi:hypothetical protein